MSEQKIQVGDKIRVTREFTVTQVSSTHIGDDIGQYSFERNDFEILEKRKPQVGDVIPKHSKASVFDALPVGTLLDINNSTGSDRSEVFLKTPAGWIYSETGKVYLVANMLAARRVVHIP